MAIGSLIPIFAAASSAGRSAMIRRFNASGATSAGTAIPFAPRNVAEGRMFDALRQQGFISEAAPDRFYLNQGELAAFHNKQMQVIRAIAAATIVGLTVAFVALR